MSAVLDVGGLPALDLHMDDAFGGPASCGICGDEALFPSFVAETSAESVATRMPGFLQTSNGGKQELGAGSAHAHSFSGGGFHAGFCEFQDLPSTLYSAAENGEGILRDSGQKVTSAAGVPTCEEGSDLMLDLAPKNYSVSLAQGETTGLSLHPSCGSETTACLSSEELRAAPGSQPATQLLYSFPLGAQHTEPMHNKCTPISFGEVVQPPHVHSIGAALQSGAGYKPTLTTPLLEPSLTSGQSNWTPGGREDVERGCSTKLECPAAKSRWKPNTQQLCLLEQHFKSGYTKATPELFDAVKGSGPSTEAQVSVWLKNRLARCRRQPKCLFLEQGDIKNQGAAGGESSEGAEERLLALPAPEKQLKRCREEENVWEDFGSIQSSIFEELSSIMRSIDSSEVLALAKAIKSATNVCCYGVGREGLVMKAFAANLFQLGLEASVVGDTSAPMLGKGDLFLASAGPSYYGTVTALSLEARRSGADVIAFTAHKTAPLPYARQAFRIASQTLPPNMPVMNRKLGGMSADVVSSLPDGKFSVLPMGASFEVSLSIILECVCVMLRKKMNVRLEDMRARCNNLC